MLIFILYEKIKIRDIWFCFKAGDLKQRTLFSKFTFAVVFPATHLTENGLIFMSEYQLVNSMYRF